jgi:hypothetical protein
MRWIKNFCFKIKILIVSYMNAIALPTVNDDGEFIDPDRVKFSYIFEVNGVKFIHCVVDGILLFLVHSPALERWFQASGILLVHYNFVVQGGKVADVNNVPDKYKNEQKLKF